MNQQEQEQRYAEDIAAIAECVVRGVSDKAVFTLASECGIQPQDLDRVLNFRSDE